jgi:hypothetical protein
VRKKDCKVVRKTLSDAFRASQSDFLLAVGIFAHLALKSRPKSPANAFPPIARITNPKSKIHLPHSAVKKFVYHLISLYI